MVKLGFHVSIQGSIDRAVDRALGLGCDTFQIFTRNPRSWKYGPLKGGDVEAFTEKRSRSGLDPVFSHMPYIMNLASPVDEIYNRSVGSLAAEVGRCSALGIPFIVTHLGSHMGSGSERGVSRVVEALKVTLRRSKEPVTLLLENGAGSRNSIGSSFDELRRIIEGVGDERLGVCFDTCHAYAAGFDVVSNEGLGSTLKTLEETVGFDRLKLVHLNDSVGALGSGIDHHEHIGLGEIGEGGFSLILHSRLAELPLIMETPVDERRSDEENIRKARELASG